MPKSVACGLLGLLLVAPQPPASAQSKVGILLWNGQTRYQQCKDGIIDELQKEGLADKVTYTVEQADGNKTTVVELAKKYAAAHMDVVVPIGTTAAVAVAEQIKDVPVVFAFVFDPVESKIAQDWKSSGNNTTGSSSKASATALLSRLKQLAPVKRLAVLYTPGERNTEAQLNDLEALKESQLALLPVVVKSRADVVPEMARLEGQADAVLLTGSSIVGDAASQIVVLASKSKIITVTQSDDHMEKGVLLGVTVSPTAVGRLAGKKLAQVLRGAKPSSVEIEALKTSDVIINMKTAKAMGVEVPAALAKAAVRTID